jgi:hypothetical protein
MTEITATCMVCGTQWPVDFERDGVEWDKPLEAGDHLLAALCEDCAPNVDVDQIMAHLDERAPAATDTIELYGTADGELVKITRGLRRRVKEVLGRDE